MTNTNIVFRTKFEKVVNEQNKEVLQKAFESFCSMASGKAIWLLWRLGITSNSVKDGVDAAPKYASEFLTHFGLDSELIQLENLDLLRSELRYQYEQKNPNFLAINAWDETCQSAYEDLKKKTDSIVAYVMYIRCVERVYIYGVENVLRLLGAREENKYFGGIRSLNFSWHEANYLKPYHEQIYKLFEALYEHQVQAGAITRFVKLTAEDSAKTEIQTVEDESAVVEAEEVKENITVSEEAVVETEEHQEASTTIESSTESASETKEEETETKEQSYVPLTVEVILENQEIFREFLNSDMNALLKIGKLGLDLNEVMAKKEKISALLDAIKSFGE